MNKDDVKALKKAIAKFAGKKSWSAMCKEGGTGRIRMSIEGKKFEVGYASGHMVDER
jgi:hypothetical protein